tara:strand:- start:1988 stop:2110 length:123 start_codon:yes stop_codon:yes gene_type:complete
LFEFSLAPIREIKVAYKGKRTRASVKDIGKSFNETVKESA